MAKSRRKQKAELREQKQEKAFFMWTGIITIICIILATVYFFSNM